VSLEDLKGWQATVFGDAEVFVAASRAQRIWREQVAKVIVGECKSFFVELRPPQPIPIPADANAVNCWVYSDYHRGTGNTPLAMTVTVADSRGMCVDLDCGLLRGRYWELRQGIVPAERLGRLHPPLHFRSLALTAGKIARPMTTYVESLAFFKRERKPYAQMAEIGEPRFPTTEDNMLPPAPDGCTVTVQPSEDGEGAVFVSASPDGVLKYTVQPREGGLSDMTAQFGDGPVFRPMAGAALRIETALGALQADGERVNLVTSRLEGDRLVTKWRFSAEGVSAEYEVRYQLRGRTLIVDLSCAGGLAEGLSLGKVRGLPEARGLEVPYLVFANFPSARIAMGGGVFASVLVDWYHSNASIIDTTAAREEPDEDGLAINGGTVYNPLTDGKRNDLADRVLITVSPDIHDTLPSIATPRSDKIDELAPAMFIMSSMFTPKYYATLKRYGLDHVIAIHFAGIWWTRAGEGFAMRWRPRPDLTEEQVAQYRADIKGLGYRWGMLVNYTCFMPVTEYWDEKRCPTSLASWARTSARATRPTASTWMCTRTGVQPRWTTKRASRAPERRAQRSWGTLRASGRCTSSIARCAARASADGSTRGWPTWTTRSGSGARSPSTSRCCPTSTCCASTRSRSARPWDTGPGASSRTRASRSTSAIPASARAISRSTTTWRRRSPTATRR
jgi:hypothetical protein